MQILGNGPLLQQKHLPIKGLDKAHYAIHTSWSAPDRAPTPVGKLNEYLSPVEEKDAMQVANSILEEQRRTQRAEDDRTMTALPVMEDDIVLDELQEVQAV